jgi:phosphoribosyl 1,2-cyclic phosphodiesterase
MLDAIMITHPHLDHINGLDDCSVYKKVNKQEDMRSIPIYAHKACWDYIENVKNFKYLMRAF